MGDSNRLKSNIKDEDTFYSKFLKILDTVINHSSDKEMVEKLKCDIIKILTDNPQTPHDFLKKCLSAYSPEIKMVSADYISNKTEIHVKY